MTRIADRELVNNLRLARAVRAKTIELLQGLSQGAFDWRPTSGSSLLGEKGGWSLGEHLDHILRVESYVRENVIEKLLEKALTSRRPVINLGLRDVNLGPAFLPDSLLNPAEVFFRIGNRVSPLFIPRRLTEQFIRYSTFPTRTPEPWQPVHAREAGELRDELAASLDTLEELLEKNGDADFQSMVFFHSVIGRHTLPQLVKVLCIHEEWHQDRIVEVLSKVPLNGKAESE